MDNVVRSFQDVARRHGVRLVREGVSRLSHPDYGDLTITVGQGPDIRVEVGWWNELEDDSSSFNLQRFWPSHACPADEVWAQIVADLASCDGVRRLANETLAARQ